MKYRIIEQRVNEQELLGKNLIVKEEDVMIDDNIFSGSWTDSDEEYKNDDSIQILVVQVIETQPARYREKVNFAFSPLGGPRLPVRVSSEMH